jgi:hypothetical protein
VQNTTEKTSEEVLHGILPGLVEECIKRHFCRDWDQRWHADRYHVVYRIGDVEERFSFASSEVAESIRVVALNMLLPMADRAVTRETTSVKHASDVHIDGLPMGATCIPLWVSERAVLRPGVLDECGTGCMGIVEHFVRSKHGIELVLDPIQKSFRRAMKRLIKGVEPSRDDERILWSLMVFGMVFSFLHRSAEHDELTVVDKPPPSADEVEKMPWNGPPLTAGELAKRRAALAELGLRTFASRLTSVAA